MQDENTTQTPVESGNGAWASRETYDAIVEQSSDLFARANTRTTELVRQYPIQAAIGGVLIGFLMGAVTARRRNA